MNERPVNEGPVPGWWSAVEAELAGLLPGLRVAFYASGGSPFHHAALVAHWGGRPVPLTAQQIAAGELADHDVLIVPGGGLQGMHGLLEPLGDDGAGQIRAWVESGGMYIGSCAGAYLPAHWPADFAEQHPGQLDLQLLDVPLANGSDAGLGGLDSPGVGEVEVEVQATGHWLTSGLPERFRAVHYNGPCFRPPADWAVTSLAGIGQAFTPWERSLPGAAPGRGLLGTRLVLERASNVIAGPRGRGTVVLFGSHPEFGFDVMQLGWGVAARLFGNALAHQARQRGVRPPAVEVPAPRPPLEPDLDRLAARFGEAADRAVSFLNGAPAPAQAPGFLGQAAPDLYRAALQQMAATGLRISEALRALARASPLPARVRPWLSSPPRPPQDYGFLGLVEMAEQIHLLMDRAAQASSEDAPAFSSPYGDWEQHPYHLLASSYLSAAGLTASAALATGTVIQLAGLPLPLPYSVFSTDRSHHD